MNARSNKMQGKRCLIGCAVLGLAWLASAAPAVAGDFHVSLRRTRPRVWVPPVYETRPRVVLVPARYEVRTREVWHEPVYDVRRVLVEVAAKVITERVPRYNSLGWIEGYDVVERVVEPARKVWRDERVLIEPGYYETVRERVCVRPASTRIVYGKVLMKPGRWLHRKATAVHRVHRPHRIGPVNPRRARPPHGPRFALYLDR